MKRNIDDYVTTLVELKRREVIETGQSILEILFTTSVGMGIVQESRGVLKATWNRRGRLFVHLYDTTLLLEKNIGKMEGKRGRGSST